MGTENYSQGDRLADLASQAAVSATAAENSARASGGSTDSAQSQQNFASDLAARAADQIKAEGR